MLAINDNNKCRALYEEQVIEHHGEGATYEYTTPGNYTLTISDESQTNCYVEIVGGGGGAAVGGQNNSYAYTAATGGSGAGFRGTIVIPVGSYTVVCGSGGTTIWRGASDQNVSGGVGSASRIGSLITAGAGGAGYHGYNSGDYTAGAAGTMAINTTIVGSPTLNTSGNNGTGGAVSIFGSASWSGGASVYGGYGAGGSISYSVGTKSPTNGSAGYVKIVLPSSTSYTVIKHYYMYN